MADKAKLIICTILFLSNTIYGLASPFLPTILDDLGIEALMTGIIFGAYAIAAAIVSPIVGLIIDKCGHAKMLCLGTILMSISCTSFGLAAYLEGNNTAIIIVAICLRVLQGKCFNIGK